MLSQILLLFFLPDILKSVESKPNLIICSLDYFSNNLTGPSVATASSPEDRLKSLCYLILGWTSPWVLVLGQGCSCQGPTSISVCVARFLSCSLCFSYSGFTVVTFRNGIPSSTAPLSGGSELYLFCCSARFPLHVHISVAQVMVYSAWLGFGNSSLNLLIKSMWVVVSVPQCQVLSQLVWGEA